MFDFDAYARALFEAKHASLKSFEESLIKTVQCFSCSVNRKQDFLRDYFSNE